MLGNLNKWMGTAASFVVEKAKASDVEALSQIHAQSFPKGWSDGDFETLLASKGYACLVARWKGRTDKPVAGFVLIRSTLDEAEVITLATRPEVRGRGIARQLMDEATRTLLGERVKRLFLEVDEANVPAVSLYRKLGFKQIGERQAYYAAKPGDGEKPSTALVMQLELG